MLGRNNAQYLRLFILSAIAICGGIFSMPSLALAAVMPTYEAAAGVSVGPKAPTTIAHDRWGRFYVVETGANRLDIYDANGVQAGRIEGLNNPLAVAISRRGLIYVGSKGDGSVTIYDKRTLNPLGKLGIGDGEFEKPTAIAIDKRGRIYVADAKRGEIKVFSPKGTLNFAFGSDGTGSGQFRHPVSILIKEYTEEILVLDFGNGLAGRVQIFDLKGNFKRSFNTIGAQKLPLVKPIGMVADSRQRLYISDVFSSQIAVYDNEGTYLGGLAAAGAAVHNPLGMAYDSNLGRLYIASLNNSRIVAFDLFDQQRRRRGLGNPPRGKRQPSADTSASSQSDSTSTGNSPACPNSSNCNPTDKSIDPASKHTLRATAGAHGRIEPAGSQQVAAGSDLRFLITPNPGYRIVNMKLDGKPINISPEQIFTDIHADHSLEVDFAAILEVGELQLDHNWKRVTFRTPFLDPVVIAKPATHNDPNPAVVRMRNLDQSGFEIRLQEWDYLDGTHGREKLSYLVVEQGAHKLSDDVQIEAGYFNHATVQTHRRIAFKQAFNTKPVIVTSITSTNEADAVTGRVQKVGLAGFDYRLQEQESNRQRHASEQIAYIAWPPSAGIVGNLSFEVARASTLVDHRFQQLAFSSSFAHTPAFIADMQTTRGDDIANLRTRHAEPLSIELQVDEEQSRDTETNHVVEEIGYLAFAASLVESGSDYDGDGLTDAEEVNTYGSSALAPDSDDDGLTDGKEQRLWGAAWSLDNDGDGFINLLDRDADNDSYPDGAEHNAGSDPADPFSIPR